MTFRASLLSVAMVLWSILMHVSQSSNSDGTIQIMSPSDLACYRDGLAETLFAASMRMYKWRQNARRT